MMICVPDYNWQNNIGFQTTSRWYLYRFSTVYMQSGTNDTSLVLGLTIPWFCSFVQPYTIWSPSGLGFATFGGIGNFGSKMVGLGIWWREDLVKMVEHCEQWWDLEILVQFSIRPLSVVWLKKLLCPTPLSFRIFRVSQMAISFIEIYHKNSTIFE